MGEEGGGRSDRVTDVVDEVYFLAHFLFFFHVVLSRPAFCDSLLRWLASGRVTLL